MLSVSLLWALPRGWSDGGAGNPPRHPHPSVALIHHTSLWFSNPRVASPDPLRKWILVGTRI
jgi:hypothetical protein